MTQKQDLALLRATWPRHQPHQREQIPRDQIHERPKQATPPSTDGTSPEPSQPDAYRELRTSLRTLRAFARLAGAAPIPASSGQTIRYRLDRSGDRKLNRALHMILVTRKRSHPATIAYIQRRLQEGKTRREANRCLKRYLARNLYRFLEHGPPPPA
jgi:hypothetical protein